MRHTDTRPLRAGALALALLGIAACQVGQRVEDLTPAMTPRGTAGELRFASPRVGFTRGELVAVREDGFIMLTDRGFTRVAYEAVRSASFEDAPGVGSWRNTPEKRASLARFSRYPFGLDDELLQRLLAAAGQDEIVDIR